MSDERTNQQLALQGGMKAVSGIQGKGEPKIGVAEFLSVAERFGIPAETRKKIEKVLEEDWSGEGPYLANYYSNVEETKVQEYERVGREIFNSPYAIGTSSGTGALHSSFVAAGVGPGTEVICSAIGFFATAAAVVEAKGIPVFCDVDESLAMDPNKIEALINERTVAISPTHVMGSVCNMEAIMQVAEKHNLKVIEDCAQSCGAKYNGRYIGTFGDFGCFSISAYKIVGGGEGGLLLCKDKHMWERANQTVECGGLWRPTRFAPPRYDGELFCGTNYRMSELEAAVDAVQLRKADSVVKRFRNVKQRILKQLKRYAEIVPQKLNDPDGEVGYLLRFYPESLELGQKIVEALNAEGVRCNMRGESDLPDWHIYHYMYPVTLRRGTTAVNCPFECPHYIAQGGSIEYSRGDCPVADDLFQKMIHVPLNQWLTEEDCDNIALGMNKVFSAFCHQDASAALWL